MSGENKFGAATRGAQSGGGEASFATIAAGENKFALLHAHAMQVGGVVQAQETAFGFAAGGKFREHSRHVPANALHTAGGVKFGEETNQHALSLPRALR
ncbi:MAG: hypothetical protein NVS9B4_10130 [Candidatus Acidiferrum sp.]